MRALSDNQIQRLPRLVDQYPTWFKGRQVLVRADLNVPLSSEGQVIDDTRLVAILPTLRYLLDQGAAVRLISHLGKPQGADPQCSLKVLQSLLTDHLKQPVVFDASWPHQVTTIPSGQVALCENLRFLKGETTNDATLAKAMAQGADCLVQEAFGCAHRQHASMSALPNHMDKCFAGLLMTQEIDTLASLLQTPKTPFVAVVGGAKLATKLPLIEALTPICDAILLGGCLANTFLAAQNHEVGNSLFEPKWLEHAKALLEHYPNTLILPQDIIGATSLMAPAGQAYQSGDLPKSAAIFDIGPDTSALYQQVIEQAGQVIWNGPMGAFENPVFAQGTECIARAMAKTAAITVLGGGETLSAYRQFANPKDVTYSCTGGGAFLALFEPHGLPGIEALIK